MARIEDLLTEIEDPALRKALEKEVGQLKDRKDFGLVFERHQPESVLLGKNIGVRAGDSVQLRKQPKDKALYKVVSLNGETATLADEKDKTQEVAADDLMVVKHFGDPIYPALTHLGGVHRGSDDPHIVINGENFHALQVLAYTHKGQFDCIYIDPPYNTGARDWKYNNDYVDDKDRFRSSKWLSFMEKRLSVARQLLKPDGVLIITIDQNELFHLGTLLENKDLFADARRQLVSITINPSGVSGSEGGLSRVEEYALFCFLGDSEPVPQLDDMLVSDADTDTSGTGVEGVRWESLLRGGNAWYRAARRNLCYPVIVSDDQTRIVGVGPPLAEEDESKRPLEIDGQRVIWPVRKDGKLGVWRVDGGRLTWLAENGYAYVSSFNEETGLGTVKYLLSGTLDAIDAGIIKVIGQGERGQVQVRVETKKEKVPKTVWYRGRHIAGGAGGTGMLNALLGERNKFSFPKSVYAVLDCLRVAVGDKKDALVLDFFVGSGTTLHATMMLNAEDGGNRRCVGVTNNEVEEKTTKALNKRGLFVGDAEYEANGIFEAATLPRVTAAATGHLADGSPVEGKYLDGRAIADGFDQSVDFFRIDYLDPDAVELGMAYDRLQPLFWLLAGGKGACPTIDMPTDEPYLMAADLGYAVLFDPLSFPDFLAAINDTENVQHLFLITDDRDAFAAMTTQLGPGRRTHMLPHDYLTKFSINRGPRA